MPARSSIHGLVHSPAGYGDVYSGRVRRIDRESDPETTVSPKQAVVCLAPACPSIQALEQGVSPRTHRRYVYGAGVLRVDCHVEKTEAARRCIDQPPACSSIRAFEQSGGCVGAEIKRWAR